MKLNTINCRIAFIIFVSFSAALISFGQTSKMENTGKNIISFSDLKFKDIGKTTKPGSETINNKEIKIIAGGADIWGKHDEFRFGYKEITGDFDLTIQVLSLSVSNKYTKAGIMARVDLSDSSQHVFYQVFPDNSARNKNNGGCEFQYRLVKGDDMKAIYPDPATAGNQFNVNFPNTFIRLKRQGDLFESYFSNDNKTWKLYSSFTLKMGTNLLVGPAVTSHNKTDFTTAIFGPFLLLKR
jgi:regulation of enolase protein 1 (concanavalin A-like superfamily)